MLPTIRFRTVDASGFFDLSRAIPVGFNRAPRDHGFLTSGRSCRLLCELSGSR